MTLNISTPTEAPGRQDAMSARIRGGLWPLALAAALSACGSSPAATGTVSTPASSATTSVSSSASPTPSIPPPVPDADSIARVLLAMPVATRPSFLDPYGTGIHGDRLGLGPTVRIAGYRSDPLFVCIQHVDMKAGTAGAWTAYAVTPHGVTSSGGSGGQCPPAPGRPRVLE